MSPARERLAAAQRLRFQVKDAVAYADGSNDDGIALSIADGDVSRALAATFLSEYPAIKARCDVLVAEAQELRAAIAAQGGAPRSPEAFAAHAARGIEWMRRWQIFVTELAAMAAVKH